ncbi:Ctr-domain-containing protein [Trichodelitschia bisporula]|uniref:Copper transport protein n=1 Tax=Trichodelitschia bisporula TaxID=703511 RepID=A0A6G1HNL5_9PEZI|nr:Ctr-domain-containing protein [Trichodelitschia bisporula]
MHHAGMDHDMPGHMPGHTMPGHDMPGMGGHKCNMNMLFTWDTTDLCIVFHGWHISSTLSLIASLLAIVALTAGYESVRELSRRYEAGYALKLENTPRKYPSRGEVERSGRIVKAAFYAVQVFYSFFIMLLFMTYNGWVMLAVAVGAFVGYLAFGNSSATKSVACH